MATGTIRRVEEFRLLLYQTAEEWAEGAACRGMGPDLFFPETGGQTDEAKEVCRGCEVRGQCLSFAIDSREKFGIWGGFGETDRNKLFRQRWRAK